MKIVFFRQLLLDDVTRKWTASQQLVYSHLLSQSILRLDCVFHRDGTSIDYTKVIDDYCDERDEIDLWDFNVQTMSALLNLSRQNVYNCIDFLRCKQYVNDNCIYCPKDIVYHGYFELMTHTGLTKHLLIFYSWLIERGQNYGGAIDTFSYKLAELFGTNESNIRTMLSRLSEKGYVKRITTEDKRYGKLLIK